MMIVCPSCGRVRIKPDTRTRREETWARLFDGNPSVGMEDDGFIQMLKIATTCEMCPECAKRTPADGDV